MVELAELTDLSFVWLTKYFEWKNAHLFMRDHYELPIGICAVYLVVIFGIKQFMQNRKGFDLKTPLFWWNVFLAVFSMLGSIYVVPNIFRVVRKDGLQADMCGIESEGANPWVFFFCMSKFPGTSPERIPYFFISQESKHHLPLPHTIILLGINCNKKLNS